MSDTERPSRSPQFLLYKADNPRQAARSLWSELRREGWLSGAPSVPSVDDIKKAFALLAIFSSSADELDDDLAEGLFDGEDNFAYWLN
jgi:hypothetical protein